jgi:hypothetical protein
MDFARITRLLALGVLSGGAALGVMVALPAIASATESGAPPAVVTRSVTPLVTITLDASQAPDLAGWLQNQVGATLNSWYPQVQPTLGGTAPGSFTVRISSSYTGVAYTSGTTITLSASYFRSHQSDVGATVHESVHVAQQYRGLAGWAVEGVADWFRFYRYENRPQPKPPASSSWTAGYRVTAYYFEYIRSHYDANFLRKMHAAGQAGNPSAETVIQQSTGKTPAQVWNEMQQSTSSS